VNRRLIRHRLSGKIRNMTKAASRKPFDVDRRELVKVFDKVPPHALEAECALLGAMILDSRVIGDVIEIIVSSDDMYFQKHNAIYEALVHLYDHHESIDIVQLKQRLSDGGKLDEIGGVDYLIQLGESVPDPTNAPFYAKLVREKSILRKLIDATGQILYKSYNTNDPVQDLLDEAEQAIFQIAENPSAGEASKLYDLLQQTYEQLEAQEGRDITGLSTGFHDFDEMTSGLNGGEMLILAARPSMGKTALALNIAEYVAAVEKQPVAIFSLEMGKQQLAQRLLCSRSGVDSQKLRRNMLSGDDYLTLSNTVSELVDAPMFIDDAPGLNPLMLRSKARRLAARHHIKLIVIDYLQLMVGSSNSKRESRQQEVSEISRTVKAVARDLDVPVICLSQLNRSAESREGHKPRMSDLRESGSIEQDADVVMMLHREEYYHRDDANWAMENPEKVGVSELIIAKQRNGPTGVIPLHFDGSTTKFTSLSRSAPPSY
jgi:replicative DNA helicase